MGKTTFRPMRAMHYLDLSDGKEIQRARDCRREDGLSDGKEKIYPSIQTAQGCGAQLNYYGEEL